MAHEGYLPRPRGSRRSFGTGCLAVGVVDAALLSLAGVTPNVATDIAAAVGLLGLPLLFLGRHRQGSSPPLGPPAPAGGDTPTPSVPPPSRYDVMAMQRRRRLQAVIAAGEGLVMVFQPIIDLRDGSRVGYEALARFPDGRPANEWFEEAHELGVGVELEMTAIRLACEDFGSTPGYLSINLSPATLVSREFHDFLARRTDPVEVIVELTEHAVVEDYAEMSTAIDAIRALGAKVAVDDAGSGISSMRHILTLAPEIIKLDRSLIATIDSDPARRALALSLAQFATGIGAVLVAEGVERAAEMTTCYESGVRYGQGYLLGRPGPLDGDPVQRTARGR